MIRKLVDSSRRLFSVHHTNYWLRNLIPGDDEKWCLNVMLTIKRKYQSLKFGQKPKPTQKPGLNPKTRMLNIWASVKGVIYLELLPEKATINSMRYRQQLNKLETEVINKGLISDKIYFKHNNQCQAT